MEKKQVSSGAEKAENLTRKKSSKQTSAKPKTKAAVKDKTVKSTEKTQHVPAKQPKKTAKEKVVNQKKEARENKKILKAQIRAEKKQKRLEKKLDAKQKKLDRIAMLKERRAERREQRKERKALLKQETKEAKIERIRAEKEARIQARVAKREAAAAERQARREHRLKVRAEKRAAKNEKRHAPGFGGWLAAVISLGVVTLALGTMLAFGWMYTGGMQADMASIHTESLYELNSVIDNLDANLSKARVANTRNEQVKLLSDIAVESEMAETILERFPMDMQLIHWVNLETFYECVGIIEINKKAFFAKIVGRLLLFNDNRRNPAAKRFFQYTGCIFNASLHIPEVTFLFPEKEIDAFSIHIGQ